MLGGLPRFDNNFLAGPLVKYDALRTVGKPLRPCVRLMQSLYGSYPEC
jgi:hypothetical protein